MLRALWLSLFFGHHNNYSAVTIETTKNFGLLSNTFRMNNIISRLKNPWLLSAIICFLVYVLVILGSITKPFATDEIYNAGWAYGIAQNGTPAYYSGEDVFVMPQQREPVSHPTLHVNLLALMILIFGLKYWALRLLGVVLFIGAILFLKYSVYHRLPKPNERLVLTGIFLVFNPLFIQESIVLTIEAQAFWFPLLAFFYAFHRESILPAKFRFYPYLLSTLGIVCLLWLKETNFPIYMGVCLLYLVLIREFKKIPAFILAGALAVALFWSSWLLYCHISGTDVWSWWNFTVKNKMLEGNGGIQKIVARHGLMEGFERILSSLRVSISWMSVPYAVLYLLAVGVRFREILMKQKLIGFFELCLLFSLALFAITKVLRPTDAFIKYEVPAHFLAAVAMADVYLTILQKEKRSLLFILCAGIIIGIFSHWLIPDRLLKIERHFLVHTLWGTGIAAIVSIYSLLRNKKSVFASLTLGLMSSIFALNTGLFVHQSINDYTTGQSWGNYGENLVAPTKWLKSNIKNGESFASFKDLQFNLRFVEGKDKSPTYEARTFTKKRKIRQWEKRHPEYWDTLMRGDIKYFILNRYSNGQRGRRLLKKYNYRKTAKIKTHEIWVKTQQ